MTIQCAKNIEPELFASDVLRKPDEPATAGQVHVIWGLILSIYGS